MLGLAGGDGKGGGGSGGSVRRDGLRGGGADRALPYAELWAMGEGHGDIEGI